MIRTKARLNRKNNAGNNPVLVGDHLIVDSRVCHGELAFRGTRVPVQTVLSYLARGYSMSYLRKSWPEVSAEAIQEAISLASKFLIQHYGGKNA